MSLSDRYSRVRKAHRANNRARPPLRERLFGLRRTLARLLRRAVLAVTILGVVAAGVSAWSYKAYVIDDPGAHISRAAIEEVIAQESRRTHPHGRVLQQ